MVSDFLLLMNNTNSSSLSLPRKPIMRVEEDGLMELLWNNGQVVLQNQRLNNNNPNKPPLDHNLLIKEDEMTSWLQYPLQQDNFSSELLFSASSAPPVAPTPVIPNFMHFSRLRGESAPSISKAIVKESMQVTPIPIPSSVAGVGNEKGKSVAAKCENTGTSSSVVSKSEIKQETEKTILVDDRKLKESQVHDTKQGRGSSSKRSRAAEIHNLSERKRRDRIKERMKALQQLIPHSHPHSDKASLLDQAIHYLKSLQLQIQIMSMGYNGMMMQPIMYSGMQQQQYMAVGMGMGMNMSFPNMLPAQTPTNMGGSGQHYSVYACVPNQQCDPTSSQAQHPGYIDPYQQFRNLQPTKQPQVQNQTTSYPSSSMVSSSKESHDPVNQNTG